MKPRNTSPRQGRAIAAGLVLGALVALPQTAVAQSTFHHAGNARLLTSDEAAVIKHPVLGLQRSALPLGLGLAVDTSLLADAALTPNLGLRWSLETGPHRFVVGARYAKFMGGELVSQFITSQQPAIKRFNSDFSGPTFYAVYGVTLGPVLVQAEARHYRYETANTSLTGAVVLNFAGHWAVVGELGTWLQPGNPLHGAAGIRYAGDNFGFSLGAAYVGLSEPLIPYNGGKIPVLPAFDLSWTFQ